MLQLNYFAKFEQKIQNPKIPELEIFKKKLSFISVSPFSPSTRTNPIMITINGTFRTIAYKGTIGPIGHTRHGDIWIEHPAHLLTE